jgi:hypothetical protein
MSRAAALTAAHTAPSTRIPSSTRTAVSRAPAACARCVAAATRAGASWLTWRRQMGSAPVRMIAVTFVNNTGGLSGGGLVSWRARLCARESAGADGHCSSPALRSTARTAAFSATPPSAVPASSSRPWRTLSSRCVLGGKPRARGLVSCDARDGAELLVRLAPVGHHALQQCGHAFG